MKKRLLLLSLAGLTLFGMSCKKNEFLTPDAALNAPAAGINPRGIIGETQGSGCADPFVTKLIIERNGQNNGHDDDAGLVIVKTIGDSISVIYNCKNGYTLKEVRVWMGQKPNAPVNNPGNPEFGQFLTTVSNLGNVPNYTVKFHKSLLNGTSGIIMAHANVFKHNTESSWGEGPRFVSPNGKAMYMKYNICEEAPTVLE